MTSELFPEDRSLRVVLDTNVVMALWHFADPGLAALGDWCRSGAVRLISSAACAGELQRVLAYSQFAIQAERQAQILADYTTRVEHLPEPDEAMTTLLESLPRCRDRDDQKFLAVAWQGRADLLLTRDKLVLKLARKPPFRGALQILTPEKFQAILQARRA